MKSLLKQTLPALLLVALLGNSAWAQGRIATVDLRKLFDNYWKTKQADAALKERAADIEKDHQTMIEDWKKAKDDYQALLADASNQTLSVEERDKRKKSAEEKFKQIKDSEEAIAQYERQARTSLDEQRKRMRDKLVEEIRAVVKAKAVSAGYGTVFDTAAESANGTPILLYASGENDLTDALLAQLNVGAPAEAAKTDEKTANKQDEKKKDKK
ncbi:MAG: OmpH family outer membrane protein [Verrucomicrobia bacterium]|jgi:outer membrane protein|nr:OmpH family outer membrane protein [Verrucomicrobiota bacterium]OQC26175.1 MAG: Outer membrane protein (OmpH-like) [Verrucomicrobia bacterium ADurb.Bin063]HRY58599.1 OmpH family outer membrane protein [Candidatus Paceibacterota bacterium]MBP8015528.1 OmpH family outer membrane protein [Verrucomicrobiota bacterium]HNR70551.1 OmpH family outer membrane protein [Verrucomicrobiota bacterium]